MLVVVFLVKNLDFESEIFVSQFIQFVMFEDIECLMEVCCILLFVDLLLLMKISDKLVMLNVNCFVEFFMLFLFDNVC